MLVAILKLVTLCHIEKSACKTIKSQKEIAISVSHSFK